MRRLFCFSKIIVLLIVLTASLYSDVAGQVVDERLTGKTISGGIVNGKAKTLPVPEYPESARVAKITGQVKVQVLIDEKGIVISAKAVDGVENIALRQASEAAALQATFSPTLLSGQPMKVSGVITYNFVADVNTNEEKLKLMGLSTFLTVAKSFSNDAEKLKRAFDGDDILGEMIADFPQFASELREVAAFHTLTPERRLHSIDTAIAAVRTKIGTESDRWQVDVGVEIGGLLGPMMFISESGAASSELASLDEVRIKGYLARLAELAAKPPLDIPKDVLEKLTELSALFARNKILQEENIGEFARRLMAFFDAIVPMEEEPTENECRE